MLNSQERIAAVLPPDTPPLLAVVVDTEEEFDWTRPFDRENTGVTAMRHQERAIRIFEKYGLRPTFVVDYPVASQPEGAAPLKEFYQSGLCEIGAHLQPWVNPPHDEKVNEFTSFPGNLAPHLEREKLRHLTEALDRAFGFKPVVYKAGRYGVGPATPGILAELGYQIDASVVPLTNFKPKGGPDFSACPINPYWFGPQGALFEVPLTVGYAGLLGERGHNLYQRAATPLGMGFRLPGILARSGLVERIRLSPEGYPAAALCRLLRAMLAQGHRVFSFTYHSPSLEPGHTPYVRTAADLTVFLDRFRQVFELFFGEMGGRPATLTEIRALAASPRQGPDGKV
ncbi:hypothetical protein JCM17960_31410 [Magnetospira thiophila]